jgi:hypothetical protein
MPVINIPVMFLDRTVTAPAWSEIRVEGRTGPEVAEELLTRFPQLRLKHPAALSPHEVKWFGLWRSDGQCDLRHEPDVVLGEDEVVEFVSYLGC